MRWILVTALVVLAGCANTTPEDTDSTVALPPAPKPIAYEAICPPGGTPSGDVCVGRIASLTESNQEPFISVHPSDPDIMAIGVNAGHTTDAPSLYENHVSIDLVRLDIFFTEDAGKTWRLSTLPYVEDPAVTVEPAESTVVGDPAIVIAEDGTVHVSGIASHSRLRGYNVFYTQSTDLGRSWSTPVVLSTDDDNDRNWMNRGPDGTLYVAWQRVGSLSEVAWSQDNGQTWRNQARGQVASGCITVSEVVFWNGTPLLACSERQDGIAVYAFDQETGDLEVVDRLGSMECYWPKLSVVGQRLFLTGEFCPGLRYAVSEDGGASWSAPKDLASLTGLSASGLMWQTVDPWDRVHLLLSGDQNHLVSFDFDGFGPERLRLTSSDMVPVPPTTIAPAYGDHYWGVAVGGHGGGMVWTVDNGLDWAPIQLAWPE